MNRNNNGVAQWVIDAEDAKNSSDNEKKAAKTAAKRHNERIKLISSTVNSIGVASLAAAIITPALGTKAANVAENVIGETSGVPIFLLALVSSNLMLGLLRSED